jgi:hypothetical protein
MEQPQCTSTQLSTLTLLQLVTLEALKDGLVKITQEVQKLSAFTDGPEATVIDAQQNGSGP